MKLQKVLLSDSIVFDLSMNIKVKQKNFSDLFLHDFVIFFFKHLGHLT